ncbi:MAG: phosphoribosyltransferase [Treponema sp.]|nr:phosphoribosyltransferase [Treponema sp.]
MITTGATMESCAGALKKAGAERVCGICLFYD